jgi:hypothetical protein
MKSEKYVTQIPCEFKTEDGETHTLTALDIQKDISQRPLFKNWVPADKLNKLKDYLINLGFEVPLLALPEGEVFGVRKLLSPIWELHIRGFKDGSIESHVEVNREYFEHLTDLRVFVAYEAYQTYKPMFPKFYLQYAPTQKFVTSISENFEVEVPPPSTMTAWKPIVGGLAIVGLATVLAYFLTRPPKEKA